MTETVRRGGRAVAGFGVGYSETGLYVSDDDLNTSRAQWAARMKQLGDAYNTFAPVWKASDPAAFTDWTNDWNALQARYKAALANTGFFTLNSTSWESLQKAMRQGYPPSSAPTVKGDWHDLFDRLTVATKSAGATPPKDVPAHLIPQTSGERAYADTAKYDVIASATGAQAPSTAAGGFLKWLDDHKTAIIVGVTVVGGVVVLGVLSPYARLLSAAVPRRRAA